MAAASADAPGGATIVPRYGWYSPVIALTASKTATCAIAAKRAVAKGFWPFAAIVLSAIAFQSRTTSAWTATATNNTIAVVRRSFLREFMPILLFRGVGNPREVPFDRHLASSLTADQ